MQILQDGRDEDGDGVREMLDWTSKELGEGDPEREMGVR